MKVDVLNHTLPKADEPTVEQAQRARLACCAAANSPEEADMFMRMLGLL